jgi:hypothetical protein
MDKQKNDYAPIHIYKPSGSTQGGLAIVCVFVVVHFSVIVRTGLEIGWFFLALLPIYALILWLLIIYSNQQHLAIYEDGLEYCLGNNRTFSRWEDMRRFESRSAGRSRILGIYTIATQKRQEGNSFERLLLMLRYPDFIPLSTVVRVPTRWDGCWTGMIVDTNKLADTEFGRAILPYAPHLFEYRKEKVKNL